MKTVITYVQFNKAVQVPPGRLLEYWSANAAGGAIRVEESDRGILLRVGRNVGETWEPTGDVVRVPWVNVLSVVERPADEAIHPDIIPAARSRSRSGVDVRRTGEEG